MTWQAVPAPSPLQSTGTNYLLYTENLGDANGWSGAASSTTTAIVAGDRLLVMSKVVTPSSPNGDTRLQRFRFSSTGTKTLSFSHKQGTGEYCLLSWTDLSTGSFANAWAHWSGNSPIWELTGAQTLGTPTLHAPDGPDIFGQYRFAMTLGSMRTIPQYAIEVYPAITGSAGQYSYLRGFQAEDGAEISSYATSTSTNGQMVAPIWHSVP